MMEQVQNFTLIRGLGRESFHWGDFKVKLMQSFPNAKIHTPNLAGTGQFVNFKASSQIQNNLDWLRNQVPFLKNKESTTLIGISMGGMLAAHWAYQFPDEVSELIVINSSFAEFSFYKRLRPKAIFKLLNSVMIKDDYMREKSILSLTTQLKSNDELMIIAAQWAKRAKQHPQTLRNFLKQLILASKIYLPPQKPQMPTLIMNGLNDQLVHPSCSEKIAESWKSTLVTHPQAGHDLPLDDSQWIIKEIKEWLETKTV